MFKVTAKTDSKKDKEVYIKNYIKPIGLKFKGFGSVRECKSFYKKHHKEIGLVADTEGHWFEDDADFRIL